MTEKLLAWETLEADQIEAIMQGLPPREPAIAEQLELLEAPPTTTPDNKPRIHPDSKEILRDIGLDDSKK
jgi:hypothetical protein